MKPTGFTPHVRVDRKTDGDAAKKRLWEQFGEVAKAKEALDEAVKREESATRELDTAKRSRADREDRLRTAFAALRQLVGVTESEESEAAE